MTAEKISTESGFQAITLYVIVVYNDDSIFLDAIFIGRFLLQHNGLASIHRDAALITFKLSASIG